MHRSVAHRTQHRALGRDAAYPTRLEHWRRVAVGACEQCGRVQIPRIAPPKTLSGWLETAPGGARYLLDPEAADGFDGARGGTTARGVVLLIGPEGGLSPAERARTYAVGFRGVRLGPRVLRTETATVAALTALQLLWGDLMGGDLAGDPDGDTKPERPAGSVALDFAR